MTAKDKKKELEIIRKEQERIHLLHKKMEKRKINNSSNN